MPFSNKIAKLTFALATCVLFILSYILYVQISDLDDAYNKVNQTNVVKLKLEQTMSSLKDAETAQRGFLLTKDSLFLQPYLGAYDKIKNLIEEIQLLTKTNTAQQRNLNALNTFIEVRFKIFATQINQYSLPEINEETKKRHLLNSKASMDSMKYHVQSIASVEEKLLAEREDKRQLHRYMTPFLVFLLIITTLTIMSFSYSKIIEQLNKSKKLLSQLINLNKTLKQKNHELELYNKELDSFTYIASHDLKEPLRKILTYSAMIEERNAQNLSEKNINYLQKIRYSAQRMQNLLDDLLLYSHASQGQKEFEIVDLNAILEDVQFNLKEEIEDSHTKILSGKLPVVKGLPFQLKQLFENLIINSIKYKRNDLSPVITINSEFISKEDIMAGQYKENSFYYKIDYSDNGMGFKQVYAEKIFELFKRVHSKNNTGTGIGLTICKKIIQNHNGFITAKSELNKGASFEVYLPYEELSIYKKEESPFSR